jgi:hypothetical protein
MIQPASGGGSGGSGDNGRRQAVSSMLVQAALRCPATHHPVGHCHSPSIHILDIVVFKEAVALCIRAQDAQLLLPAYGCRLWLPPAGKSGSGHVRRLGKCIAGLHRVAARMAHCASSVASVAPHLPPSGLTSCWKLHLPTRPVASGAPRSSTGWCAHSLFRAV